MGCAAENRGRGSTPDRDEHGGRCQVRRSQGEALVEKLWLKSYPKGVPNEIDVNAYTSVREVFEESCAKFASRRAFSCTRSS